MNNHDIGNALKIIRTELNLTQKEVANHLHINSSTLAKIESGTKNISMQETLNLLNYYNIPLQSITELVVEKNKDQEIIILDQTYNKIIIHYQKYKDTNLHLIQKEIDIFKKFFKEANDYVSFNMKHNIQWFTQLTFILPRHFPQQNKIILEKYIDSIIKRKYWLQTDYLAISHSIPFLDTKTVLNIYNKVIQEDFDILQNKHRRYFELMLENLSDYFLINYKTIPGIPDKLDLLFEKWNSYIQIYQPVENKIMYDHNYSMYLMLFNKLDKEIIYNECLKRNEALQTLGLSNISVPMLEEAKSYKNNTNGTLNIALFSS